MGPSSVRSNISESRVIDYIRYIETSLALQQSMSYAQALCVSDPHQLEKNV